MSLATKNVATVLVGSVLVLALSFAFVTPAKADLLSDLQAQVQALLAQIAALGGGSTTTGGSCTTFTMDFQQGSSGAEVIAIQKFLNSHGAQVAVTGAGSPGNETSYYGALTKAAVAKFQAANGITPAAGYWGPITRAKANSMCSSTPTTPTTPGGETLNGSAGSISVQPTTADVEDEVYSGETEKVLGFRIEASGADVRVTNVRIRFDYTGDTTGSDRLGNYFSEISIWANGQKIAAMSPSSFVRDGAGEYSASIPVSQVVRMGSNNKVTFHVGATANSSLDSDDIDPHGEWTVDLTQTRYVDPSGATLFDSRSGTPSDIKNEDITVDRLSSSSDVKFRLGEGSGNPDAGNVSVDDDGSTEVTLVEFTLKADGAAMEFDSLTATSTVTGVATTSTMVQEFYLMRGSSRIAEADVPTSNGVASHSGVAKDITFDLDDTEELSAGSTQTYRIVAKLNEIAAGSGSATAFDQGDSLEVELDNDAWSIDAKTSSDGKTVADGNRTGSVTTGAQTFLSSGVTATMSSSGTATELVNGDSSNSDNQGKYVVEFTVKAFDESAWIPLTAASSTSANSSNVGLAFTMEDASTGSSVQTGTTTAVLERLSGGSVSGGYVKVDDGASVTLRLTVYHDAAATGNYRVQLGSVGFNQESAANPDNEVTLAPAENFESASVQVLN